MRLKPRDWRGNSKPSSGVDDEMAVIGQQARATAVNGSTETEWVLAKSEAEFPVDFEEGIDDRRSKLAVQQRLLASHARSLDDCSERCGILSMPCRSFRCPAVWVLRPSPFLNNVSGRPGAPKPMGVSAGSPSSRGWSRRFRQSPGGVEKLRISEAPVRPAPGSPSPLFLL